MASVKRNPKEGASNASRNFCQNHNDCPSDEYCRDWSPNNGLCESCTWYDCDSIDGECPPCCSQENNPWCDGTWCTECTNNPTNPCPSGCTGDYSTNCETISGNIGGWCNQQNWHNSCIACSTSEECNFNNDCPDYCDTDQPGIIFTGHCNWNDMCQYDTTDCPYGWVCVSDDFPGSEAFCTPANEQGDVNQDGVVNVQDLVQLVQHVLHGTDPNTWHAFQNADMNNDGILNVIDVVGLVNQLLSQGRINQQQANQITNQLGSISSTTNKRKPRGKTNRKRAKRRQNMKNFNQGRSTLGSTIGQGGTGTGMRGCHGTSYDCCNGSTSCDGGSYCNDESCCCTMNMGGHCYDTCCQTWPGINPDVWCEANPSSPTAGIPGAWCDNQSELVTDCNCHCRAPESWNGSCADLVNPDYYCQSIGTTYCNMDPYAASYGSCLLEMWPGGPGPDATNFWQRLGDTNNDGIINVVDIIAIINVILGGYHPWMSDYFDYNQADYNRDGVISIVDIIAIVNRILGNGLMSNQQADEIIRQAQAQSRPGNIGRGRRR